MNGFNEGVKNSLNEVLAELNGAADVEATPFTNGVLAEAFAQRKKQRQDRLVAAAISVTEQIEGGVEACVSNLRKIRKAEKEAKAMLEKVNLATKYFAATGNPLPYYDAVGRRHDARFYCERVGAEIPAHDDKLWSVPAGWQE